MNFRKSLVVSLLIHTAWTLMVVGVIALGGKGEGQRGPTGSPQPEQTPGQGQLPEVLEVDIIPPPKKQDTNPDAPDLDEDGILQKAPHASDDCDSYFGGIGITQSWVSDPNGEGTITVVDEVHDGYPASRAGLMRGDQILNRDEIRGKIGTTVVVEIRRHGMQISFIIVRDKICTSPIKESP